MGDIGVGDWVELIEIDTSKGPSHGVWNVGSIYQVESCGEYNGVGWITCVRMPKSSHPTGGWLMSSFRPIYRPKENLFNELLESIKEKA